MTLITTKSDGVDIITAADMNTMLGKIQSATDRDVNIFPTTFASVVYPTGFTGTRLQNALNSLPSTGGAVVFVLGAFTSATTIRITKPATVLSGLSMNLSSLTYTGTSTAIMLDGVSRYMSGAEIHNLTINANGHVGIHMKGRTPNVVTRTRINSVAISTCSTGIFMDSGSGEVYRNSVRDVYILGVAANMAGIHNVGPYNYYESIEIANTSGYAIRDGSLYGTFLSISTDGVSKFSGQNALIKNFTIEGIYSSTVPSNEAIRLDGYDYNVSDVTLVNLPPSKVTYGLSIYNGHHVISNLQATGSSYAAYLFIPSDSSSQGIANGISGSASIWSHLTASRVAGWVFNGGLLHRFGGATISNATTVLHGLPMTPNRVFLQGRSASPRIIQLTGTSASSLTLGFWNTAGSAINESSRIYWNASA